MKMITAIAVAMTAAVSATTHADFVGFEGEDSINSQGNNVVKMYAIFDDANNVLLNIYNSEISGNFIQNDVQAGAGGTWSPNASLDIPNFSDSDNDSYVTIGYGVGTEAASNQTGLDPNFGTGIGGTIPVNAGWFNGNPTTVISGDRILIGQFVFSSELADFQFIGNVGFKSNATNTDVLFGSGSWSIPAPGALALLGLGGLVARSRRG